MTYLILFAILLFASNCKTSNAIALDCTFANVSLTLLGSRYACTARVLFDGNEQVTAVYGTHQSGRGYNDVLTILIQSQNLLFIPTNIETFFPSIIGLNFFTNSISNVRNNHLIPFPNLDYLFFSTNKISSLDSNLFSGLTSMRVISFNSNDIKHIGHDIRLPDSGNLNFEGNPCINQIATTPAQIITLKLNLLRNCPPTISQIEDTLESRPNLLTNVNFEVQGLLNKTEDIDDVVRNLTNVVTYLSDNNVQLETRIAFLEAIIENKLGIKIEEAINEADN